MARDDDQRLRSGLDTRLSEALYREENPPLRPETDYERGAMRIFSMRWSGIELSEQESREIILKDCPKCPEAIVQRILNKLGF